MVLLFKTEEKDRLTRGHGDLREVSVYLLQDVLVSYIQAILEYDTPHLFVSGGYRRRRPIAVVLRHSRVAVSRTLIRWADDVTEPKPPQSRIQDLSTHPSLST